MKRFFREVSRGLATRHLAILVGAALLLLLGLVGFESAMRAQAWASIPIGWSRISDYDQYTNISYDLLRLKKNPTTPASVLLFGGSGMRECVESVDELALAAGKLGAPAFNAFLMTSTQQTFGDVLLLIDQIPRESRHTRHRTVLLVGVNPSHFIRSPADYALQLQGEKFPFLSAHLRAFMRSEGQSLDWPAYFSTYAAAFHLKSWLSANRDYLRHGKIPRHSVISHYYHQQTRLSPLEKQAFFEKWIKPTLAERYQANVDFNYRALTALIQRSRQKHFDLILIEQPASPLIETLYPKLLSSYRQRIRQYAIEQAVPYWTEVGQGLVDADFHDFFHLVESGRQKYQGQLAQALKNFLGEHEFTL